MGKRSGGANLPLVSRQIVTPAYQLLGILSSCLIAGNPLDIGIERGTFLTLFRPLVDNMDREKAFPSYRERES